MQLSLAAIIGAGPAGLATALQLKRYAVPALLFECNRVGGLLWNANRVENYPGFPGGIPGPRLVELFIEQARGLDIDVIAERVESLRSQDDFIRVETERQVYFASIVVIASGTKPKLFTGCPIPPEIHERIFYEVIPLLQQKDRRIAIIGAGDAAFDYALSLAPHNEVVILNRGDEAQCLPLLWERVSGLPGIAYYPHTRLSRLDRSGADQLVLECVQPHGNLTIQADYLLCATGRQPQLDFMSPTGETEVERLEKEGRLYFIGDVKNGIYRQTAIAVGDGIMTAMKIYRQLKGTLP